MKVIFFAVATLVGLGAIPVHAGPSSWILLGKNTIQGTIDTTEIICTNGVRPNGHNFPSYATISISQNAVQRTTADGITYRGWYGSNVPGYALWIADLYDCGALPPELKAGQIAAMTAVQTLGEIDQIGNQDQCQRTLTEDIRLRVGALEFSGYVEMTVLPIDLKYCASIQ